jgi:hypothetical protein
MANTPMRAVRISEEVWRPALACAEANGDTITDIVRHALTDYIANHDCGTHR